MKEKLIQQGLNWFDLEQSWILLYFSTSWCAPCKSMVPIMAEVKAQYKHQLKTVKVDVDENIELARRLDVRGVPAQRFPFLVACWTQGLRCSLSENNIFADSMFFYNKMKSKVRPTKTVIPTSVKTTGRLFIEILGTGQ